MKAATSPVRHDRVGRRSLERVRVLRRGPACWRLDGIARLGSAHPEFAAGDQGGAACDEHECDEAADGITEDELGDSPADIAPVDGAGTEAVDDLHDASNKEVPDRQPQTEPDAEQDGKGAENLAHDIPPWYAIRAI